MNIFINHHDMKRRAEIC